MVEIKTMRLVMRPVATEDKDHIVATLNDFEVSKFLSAVPFPYGETDAIEWVKLQAGPDETKSTNFTVYLHDGTYCGAVGFDDGEIGPELGYYINRQQWGNGYVSEAASAAIDWLFACTDVQTILSGAYTFNPASLAVQAKLGFVETGIEDRMSNPQGKAFPLITTALQRKNFTPVH